MKKIKDQIVAGIRKAREEVLKEYQRDPIAFKESSEEMCIKLHLRRSKLKPIAKSLREIREKKLRKKIA